MNNHRVTRKSRITSKEICPICNTTGHVGSMIMCVSCYQWWHYNCLEFQNIINSNEWICMRCTDAETDETCPVNPVSPAQFHTTELIMPPHSFSDNPRPSSSNFVPVSVHEEALNHSHHSLVNVQQIESIQKSTEENNPVSFSRFQSSEMIFPPPSFNEYQRSNVSRSVINSKLSDVHEAASSRHSRRSKASDQQIEAVHKILQMNEQCLQMLSGNTSRRSCRSSSSISTSLTQRILNRTHNWVEKSVQHNEERELEYMSDLQNDEFVNCPALQPNSTSSCNTFQTAVEANRSKTFNRSETPAINHDCNTYSQNLSKQANNVISQEQQTQRPSAKLLNNVEFHKPQSQLQKFHNHDHDTKYPNTSMLCNPSDSVMNQPELHQSSMLTLPKNHESTHNNDVTTHLIKILARQSFQDLPVFDGNFNEWLTFINFYNSTKNSFNTVENHGRLLKSLKGEARNSVQSLLIDPNNVPAVIDMLQFRYGSTEKLISSLINKARSFPVIKDFQFKEQISFATEVKNLCSSLISAGANNHLNNPMLINELVSKLSLGKQVSWQRHRLNISKQDTDVQDFSNWLLREVLPLNNMMTNEPSNSSSLSPVEQKRSSKSKKELNYSVNLHTSSISHDFMFCKKNGHKIYICRKFKSLKNDDRWKFVKEHHLCFNCLKMGHDKNSEDCPKTSCCGKSNCQAKHHPILHPVQTKECLVPEIKAESPESVTSSSAVNCHDDFKRRTLFRIIPVTLYGPSTSLQTYAFLDDGSNSTLIDKEVADLLKLSGKIDPLCLQ